MLPPFVSQFDCCLLVHNERLHELMRRARARDVDAYGEHTAGAALQLHDVLRGCRNLRCFFVGPLGPKRGALVEARVGKGRWIYIGLVLWRELPAGVPGAYQLLANLISLRP